MKHYLIGATLCLALNCLPTAVHAATSATTDTAAAQLKWVSLPATHNICCGYYLDPLADMATATSLDLRQAPITINATAGSFHATGTSNLLGHVSLQQPGRLVTADQLILHNPADKTLPRAAALSGHVTLNEPGKLLVGDNAYLELHTRVAHFVRALYRITLETPIAHSHSEASLNAWGKAATIAQDKSGLIKLTRATYSTCAPTSNTWRVQADRIILDRASGRGQAYNATFKIKDVPVLYTPYFDFPIDARRESGFLFPSFGLSSHSGYNFSLPYYWNIAPNYDALLTPTLFTARGLQFNTTVRYLTTRSTGDFTASYLPHDLVFQHFKQTAASNYADFPALGRLLNSSADRAALILHDATHYDAHWTSSINYNFVSDDYYVQDFSNISTVANNQLLQQAQLNYAGDNWLFNGLLQNYQTLHPVNQAAVNNPYSALPQLNWNGLYPDAALGLTYQFNNQLTYFDRAPNPGELTPVPSAARLNIQPGVSLPLTGMAGFVTPALQVALTQYNIASQAQGFASNVQRNVPIFNIDSGLYFDRAAQVWGDAYQQTLEPRLFYLWAPYRNQDSIPIFDTGILPFTYDSLFMTNRFSGLDRVGDANQVAYALTSRFLDANTGAEKFRASIGQLYYFANRQVNLCVPGAAAGLTPSTASSYNSCNVNPLIAVGATSSTEKFSPVAGQLAYNFNPHWSATANIAWDPNSNTAVNGSTNLQYKPAVNHVLNLNYNYIRFGDTLPVAPNQPPVAASSHFNDLNQGGFSVAWPVRERLNAVGGYTYNFSHQYPQTYFYGLQYDTCCWGVRLVAGRLFTSLNQNNNPTFNNMIYLQWQLKGLSNLSTADPSNFLLNSIPGYSNNFQPLQGLTA